MRLELRRRRRRFLVATRKVFRCDSPTNTSTVKRDFCKYRSSRVCIQQAPPFITHTNTSALMSLTLNTRAVTRRGTHAGRHLAFFHQAPSAEIFHRIFALAFQALFRDF